MLISRFMICALLSIAQSLAFLQMRFINFPLFFFMEYITTPQASAYFLQGVSIVCAVWVIDNAIKCEDAMVKYGFIGLAGSNLCSSTNKFYEIVKTGDFSYLDFFCVSSFTFLIFLFLFLIKIACAVFVRMAFAKRENHGV